MLIEQVICLKCCWKLEAVAQLSSVKMRLWKASQISQKVSKIESLFCKTVSSQAFNWHKKDHCREYIYVNMLFSFLLVCFRENKRNHRRCSVKKSALKNLANFKGKHLCRSLFLTKLQAFCEHLWTIASKRSIFV